MKLWKIKFVVDTGVDYEKREAIVWADTNADAIATLNRECKLGHEESIHCASAIKIDFDFSKHGMIYCTKGRMKYEK